MQTDYTQTIIDTINKIFSMLFSSLDLSIYSLLDKTVFINSSIVNDKFFSLAFNSSFGLSIIANALLAGFFIYYCFKLYMAPFSGSYVEKPYQFLTKVLIIAICISFSQFLCSEFLSIIDILTDILKSFGMQLTGKEISFNTLLSSSTYVIENSNNFNFFSFDGILKSFFSFGLINLLFSYSIRYILIKILILLFPFALLSLVTASTSWIFKSWFRTFFSLIFVQIFIIFVLILLFSLNINTSDMFSQISYISTVFILTKSNSYIKELLGGISTDLNYNIFPRNYNIHSKFLGIISYSSLFFNLLWDFFVYCLINLLFLSLTIKTFLFIIFTLPILLLSIIGINNENIFLTLFYLLKFIFSYKLYLFNKLKPLYLL